MVLLKLEHQAEWELSQQQLVRKDQLPAPEWEESSQACPHLSLEERDHHPMSTSCPQIEDL
jgi:hypothetical protein